MPDPVAVQPILPDESIDCIGLFCPMPIVKTREALTSMAVARGRTSDRVGPGAMLARAAGTSWRSRWRHGVQAAPGAPRGLKPLGRRAGRRKDRGAGGERVARAAARNAYAAIHKAP